MEKIQETQKTKEEIIAERHQRLTDRIMGTVDVIFFPIAVAGMLSLPFLPENNLPNHDRVTNYNTVIEKGHDNYMTPARQISSSSEVVYQTSYNPSKR